MPCFSFPPPQHVSPRALNQGHWHFSVFFFFFWLLVSPCPSGMGCLCLRQHLTHGCGICFFSVDHWKHGAGRRLETSWSNTAFACNPEGSPGDRPIFLCSGRITLKILSGARWMEVGVFPYRWIWEKSYLLLYTFLNTAHSRFVAPAIQTLMFAFLYLRSCWLSCWKFVRETPAGLQHKCYLEHSGVVAATLLTSLLPLNSCSVEQGCTLSTVLKDIAVGHLSP